MTLHFQSLCLILLSTGLEACTTTSGLSSAGYQIQSFLRARQAFYLLSHISSLMSLHKNKLTVSIAETTQ